MFFFKYIFFRGYIDFQERVSHYWPEFAQNGKESITVEMLINHQVTKYTHISFHFIKHNA